MIGIGIVIRIGIGGVGGIQRGGQYLPLQVTIQGGRQEVVVRGYGGGVLLNRAISSLLVAFSDKDRCAFARDENALLLMECYTFLHKD